MAKAVRPKPTHMTVCDICDEEIPDGEPGEVGSLTHGFIAHRVEMPSTTWARLFWPPAGRDRRIGWEQRQKPENRPRRYDFHADCILRLVEDAIKARTTERSPE
ncbi:hypothetical protein AB0I72_19410 [Nocardiopsis sp. NPDC049922]|uniref:hypothetical protein n=1 Tax=Nocardiopsis sp. NPDC049922 TaxID=3155157 RepID=UPI00341068D5